MFSANAKLQPSLGRTPSLGRQLDHLAHAIDIDRDERIPLQHPLLDIRAEKLARVVAREAHRRLREIVGAEREELGALGNLRRLQRRARQLDHGADEIGDRLTVKAPGAHRVKALTGIAGQGIGVVRDQPGAIMAAAAKRVQQKHARVGGRQTPQSRVLQGLQGGWLRGHEWRAQGEGRLKSLGLRMARGVRRPF